jgi:hypothetical protein
MCQCDTFCVLGMAVTAALCLLSDHAAAQRWLLPGELSVCPCFDFARMFRHLCRSACVSVARTTLASPVPAGFDPCTCLPGASQVNVCLALEVLL